ncbi:DUF2163 domain-containing protein [Salibaculum griseiflavum]|uniref:Bacteriophage phiJL001 Gp84 C-terminal domain-containing protein n=1 Tax=Salibaculum griseiflavum TaxID=1914409 RepID=A0A2V1P7F2_9RHOB|nr:DUF2163 domain-containing protein [Salibaculum griseiflavum]PWG18266.1 hypothetical protein DFK10_03185 [Salibaculum griseiflavum]
MSGLIDHLATGLTTTCWCWAIVRTDGVTFGFTDHDLNLEFEGIEFKAQSGLTARAVMAGSGLSVDNSEAMGALSDAAVTETDIEAGRYDAAEVRLWQVNWADPEQRALRFRGHIGELRRKAGAFHAELRGLTEALNQPQGRVYQAPCAAVLGDARCGVDLSEPAYSVEAEIDAVDAARVFHFSGLDGFEPDWFTRGTLNVLTGPVAGLFQPIKQDDVAGDGTRTVGLWQPLGAAPQVGDRVRLVAGCDKRAATCRLKFSNFINFQGFPHIPGEDWLMRVPRRGDSNSGGSLA